ncbi:efflux RND transporter periplasmic adaptor subunit [Nevskia sp.]|uniref:efflux RND transporter periplasmic adaptor subunit n=1 Tax=Nevskia sp. TaxID=1929292 RepID=UPI0025F53658|nr:efflux RND transporter periplasmic adaptor subunit [Nevskia sp.]
MPRLAVAAAIGPFAALLLLSGCHKSPADPRQLPPRVRVAQLAAPAAAEHHFTGVITARVQSDLGFRVPGKVVERLVDNGDTVKRGQPLMRIDVADLQLDRSARLAAVEAARARAEQTAADELRYRGLVEHGAISVLAHAQSKTAALAAAAELQAVEAQADVATHATDYAVLRADASGVVVDTLAEPGQVVAAGQPVIRLARNGAREARVDLPETLRPAIGSMARARLYGDAQKLIGARLRQLSAAADPLTRTFEARYALDDEAERAPLGATVTLQIGDPNDVASARVPLSAITDQGKGPGVWIVEADAHQEAVVAWRPVTIASLDDEAAKVVAGLASGDRFVAMGAHLLHVGDRVRIADDATATTQPVSTK